MSKRLDGLHRSEADRTGAIARGAIHLAGPNTVRWEWNSTSLAGKFSRYEVEMTFEQADKYRFVLFERTDDAALAERVNVVYTRVDDAPEPLKKLRAGADSAKPID